MSQVQGPGLADLEKELGCSICTELLYQPLTLLDCLHTFCGSCLKEWFNAQGSRHRPSGSSPQFTCPSCRAAVRGTRPNATVTTLLDMVLMAQPDRDRSATEKEEIAQRYKHGDSVFPPPPRDDESAEEDEDDQRILEEVRELSLRENRAQARREARRTAGLSERHTDDGRARRRRDEDSEQQRPARAQGDPERARRIEHQSSLRSLLSLSSETETMEEEILRQIIEDGLLDDIDLDNLGPSQEDELSERIADAYRRRHMQQPRSRQGQRRRPSPESSNRSNPRSQSAPRTSETTTTRDGARRPPASRPHLFDPSSQPPAAHQRRNSEQGNRRRTSPVRVNQASNSEDALRPAVRSSSDMTVERSRIPHAGRVRAESSTSRPRRATESEQNISGAWLAGGRERASRQVTSQSATNSPTSVTSPQLGSPHSSTPTEHTSPPSSSPLVPGRSDRRNRPSSSRSNAPGPANVQFLEPSVSCNRCGRANTQYDLHKKCLKCKDGNFSLCLRCYRSNRGCLEWDGFGPSAKVAFERMVASSNDRPVQVPNDTHILDYFKYQRPSGSAQIIANGERQMTSDDPARRLETGLFCDICLCSANECYWRCNLCNEGDWGFCNRCVNQGRCCTHALLPIRRIASSPSPSAPSTPADMVSNNSHTVSKLESFKILSFSTNCDICTYPIPASVTRFHCAQCNSGDYDVCMNCYLKLVATSKISKENGHNGWRRCLAGHRMVIIGFEDHQDGQRRVIVRDLVGGHALKDEHVTRSASSSPATSAPITFPEIGGGDWSWKDGPERRKKASRQRAPVGVSGNSQAPSSDPTGQSPGTPTSHGVSPFRRFPPDGGVGLIVHALWSWYPEEDVEDELTFPRGADIKEVENINDDWFWGCYAGRTGLFPGAHVTATGEIK
ncbi:hypothetical protein N7492_005656 [Penicillium capsulatum]|uniref:RING-type domain-containing protein n=1 Tax=Penicillium capsulatum TaxID=69766 RepID=A0A9W9LSC3_9EURO|nr:hypothetical protein N7492_005656 [Penicillium capsulatum]KAJ6135247.1 hypothetical protein N7512_000407 [Penicillium capsulatum]